eukprot:11076912-Karenia_brevis.AAC.1
MFRIPRSLNSSANIDTDDAREGVFRACDAIFNDLKISNHVGDTRISEALVKNIHDKHIPTKIPPHTDA